MKCPRTSLRLAGGTDAHTGGINGAAYYPDRSDQHRENRRVSGPSRAEKARRHQTASIRQLGPWPYAPIAELLAARHGHPLSDTETATELGVSRHRVLRWRHTGLTETAADRVATRLGYHPTHIWPDLYHATTLIVLGHDA